MQCCEKTSHQKQKNATGKIDDIRIMAQYENALCKFELKMHQSYWADSKWLETAQEYIWPTPNSIKFFDIFPASSNMIVTR